MKWFNTIYSSLCLWFHSSCSWLECFVCLHLSFLCFLLLYEHLLECLNLVFWLVVGVAVVYLVCGWLVVGWLLIDWCIYFHKRYKLIQLVIIVCIFNTFIHQIKATAIGKADDTDQVFEMFQATAYCVKSVPGRVTYLIKVNYH